MGKKKKKTTSYTISVSQYHAPSDLTISYPNLPEPSELQEASRMNRNLGDIGFLRLNITNVTPAK